jgi:hypothetical protein
MLRLSRNVVSRSISSLTAFAAALCVATIAGAAVITDVTGSSVAAVTATSGDPGAADYYALPDSASGIIHDCPVGGCTAFDAALQGGAGIEADGNENLRISLEWTFTIDIVVSASATEVWELVVDSQLLGYLTAIDQGPGRARGRVNDLTGTVDTADLGVTGSMDLLGTDQMNAPGGANQLIDRVGTFTVTGGFGPTTVSMTFTLDGRLRSQCGGQGCNQQGDEAAIRLGVPGSGTPPGFTAGNYPGPDGATAGEHGLLLAVGLVTLVPEPGSAILVGSGLLLLLGSRRRHA